MAKAKKVRKPARLDEYLKQQGLVAVEEAELIRRDDAHQLAVKDLRALERKHSKAIAEITTLDTEVAERDAALEKRNTSVLSALRKRKARP